MKYNISNFFKQYAFMLALAATFVGFSAFKVATYSNDPISGWYSIDFTGSNSTEYDDTDKQLITGHIPTGPDGTCDPEVEEAEPCAVYLDFSAYTGSGLTSTSTVQDVETDLAQVDPDGAGDDDGYARRDE